MPGRNQACPRLTLFTKLWQRAELPGTWRFSKRKTQKVLARCAVPGRILMIVPRNLARFTFMLAATATHYTILSKASRACLMLTNFLMIHILNALVRAFHRTTLILQLTNF